MIRHALLAGAAIAILAVAAPASAGEARSFDAWGHRFTVPGTPSAVVAVPAPVRATGSAVPLRAYTAAVADAPRAEAPAAARADRRLNVWGAQIDASAR